MYQSLPAFFRKQDLSADIRTLLSLRRAYDKGLVKTLGDLYLVLRGLVSSSPQDYGPFATAFYEYFLDIIIKKGEKLENAVARSEAFKEWKKKHHSEDEVLDYKELQHLVERFLDEVHLTSYEIQKILSGTDILNNDDPNRTDNTDQEENLEERVVNNAADYSNIPMEELLKRMEQVAEQQKRDHQGGDHWIGSGGMSPFGQNGPALGGIRAGGSGGGKMARAVIGNSQYYPVDIKAILSDDNIDVALANLKGIEDESAEVLLDIPKTIEEGVKLGGLFLPVEKEKKEQKVQVILMIDNGGLSMTPYIKQVTKLFSKMKLRFAHDLKTYYFHNTIYGGVWSDARRTTFVSVEKLAKLSKNYSVFIIGDADMAPYELTQASQDNWKLLKKHFPRIVWMNPMALRIWTISDTVKFVKRIFPMYQLTPEGIEEAVLEMNKKRKYSRR